MNSCLPSALASSSSLGRGGKGGGEGGGGSGGVEGGGGNGGGDAGGGTGGVLSVAVAKAVSFLKVAVRRG